MVEKNIVGTYNISDAYPVFQHEAPDEPAIKPVDYSLPTTSRVASIRGSISSVDPIDQWRSFSERLKARRLAQEQAQEQPDPESPQKQAAPRRQPPEQSGDQFQRTYEQDMVNIDSHSDPMVLGLQRYLSLVNDPIPDEHLKAYETSDEHEGAEAQDLDAIKEGEEAEYSLPVLRVREVMTRKVVCVLESTTIEQVASLCNRRGISGVPVVNEKQALVGIVTLTDIINQLFNTKSLSTYAEQGGQILEQKALAILDEPVRNYMHREVVTVLPETPVREACEVMMRHRIRRVVVARGDVVRGVFSSRDAVKVLSSADLAIEETPAT